MIGVMVLEGENPAYLEKKLSQYHFGHDNNPQGLHWD
jgi:hypothetical protein